MRNLLLLFLHICIIVTVNAREIATTTSPRQTAMGDVPALQTGIWALFDNPAGISTIKSWEAGVCHHSLYHSSGLSEQMAGTGVSNRMGTFGVGISTFGYSVFRQNRYLFNYALTLSKKLSAGVRFNFAEWRATEGYGRSSMAFAEVGMQYYPAEGVSVGLHYFNPYGVPVSGNFDVETATGLRAGISYSVSGAVIALGASKWHNTPLDCTSGVEVTLLKKVRIRGGIGLTKPDYALGAGMLWKHLSVDVAVRHHAVLGYSPMFSLNSFF